MYSTKQIKKLFIFNTQLKYSYKCTNIRKHNLNFLVLFRCKRDFVIFNDIWHFSLLKYKLFPFFNSVPKGQHLFPVFTVNAPTYFSIVEVAAKKSNGVAIGNWISGSISAKMLKRSSNTTIYSVKKPIRPNILVTPSSINSKIAVMEAKTKKIASIGGLEYGNFKYLQPNYFIMGNSMNYKFVFQFCLLISSLIASHNTKRAKFLEQQQNLVEIYHFYIKKLILKNKIKVKKLKKRKRVNKKRKLKKKWFKLKRRSFAQHRKIKRRKKKLKSLLSLCTKLNKYRFLYKNLYLYCYMYWAPSKFSYLKYWNRRFPLRQKIKRYSYLFKSKKNLLVIKSKKIKFLLLKKLKKKIRFLKNIPRVNKKLMLKKNNRKIVKKCLKKKTLYKKKIRFFKNIPFYNKILKVEKKCVIPVKKYLKKFSKKKNEKKL